MFKRDEVLGFVRRWLNEGDTPEEWVTMFRLVLFGKYEDRENDTGEIETFPCREPGKRKLLKTPDSVADEVEMHVKQQTEAIGGKVKFRLLAYQGVGNRKPRAFKSISHFHMEPDEGDEQELEPTAKGRTRQDMIHVERMLTIAETSIQDTMRTLRADNDSMREMMGTVMGKFVALVPVIEGLMTQAHMRNLATDEHAQKMKLLNEIGDRALTMLPHLVNWYFKMPVMPASEKSPAELAIREVLGTLQFEQFQTVLGALNDVQKAPLLAIYKRMLDEKEAESLKAAEKLSSAVPSRMMPAKTE